MLTAYSNITSLNQVSFRVLHSFDEAEPLRNAWDDLVLGSGGDLYQTYDWCRLWWHYYGKHRKLHLLLLYSDGKLTGIFPGFTESLWLGPAHLRVAKLVGSDFSLQLCNLPAYPETVLPLVSKALRYFLGEQRCDVLLVGPISGESSDVATLLALEQEHRDIIGKAEQLGNSCNTYFRLPGTFAEYLSTIGKQQRGNLNRTITQFSKEHRVSFDVVAEPGRVREEFDRFHEMHGAQWSAQGKLGHFRDWPNATEFNRDLVHCFESRGAVRFYRILAGQEVVSSQFTFSFNKTVYWRLPARASASSWDRLSLGRMGLGKMIEAAIGEGCRFIEGGRGHYD